MTIDITKARTLANSVIVLRSRGSLDQVKVQEKYEEMPRVILELCDHIEHLMSSDRSARSCLIELREYAIEHRHRLFTTSEVALYFSSKYTRQNVYGALKHMSDTGELLRTRKGQYKWVKEFEDGRLATPK